MNDTQVKQKLEAVRNAFDYVGVSLEYNHELLCLMYEPEGRDSIYLGLSGKWNPNTWHCVTITTSGERFSVEGSFVRALGEFARRIPIFQRTPRLHHAAYMLYELRSALDDKDVGIAISGDTAQLVYYGERVTYRVTFVKASWHFSKWTNSHNLLESRWGLFSDMIEWLTDVM